MKRFQSIIAKSLLFLLAGCASIPIATDTNPTLLIGQIVYNGYNNPVSRNGISFNGTRDSGIDITMTNTTSGGFVKMTSGKNGLFFSGKIQEGKYCIDDLYLKIMSLDSAGWAYITASARNQIFEIREGKVNNIGIISWTHSNDRNRVDCLDSTSKVRNDFTQQFAKSNWNQKEWLDCRLKGDTTYYVKSSSGVDSTRLTIPRATLDEDRLKIEENVRNKLGERIVAGDTTYYVKSESGIDSIVVTMPKNIPDAIRKQVEKNAIEQMGRRK